MTDNKECPFCAETIKAAAKKCCFCGEWLDGQPEGSVYGDSVSGDKVGGDKTLTGDVKGSVFIKPEMIRIGENSLDYQILSQAHDDITKMKNMLIQHFRPSKMERKRVDNFTILVTKALQYKPTLERVMGDKWGEKYLNTILEAVIITKKMSGFDIIKEFENVKTGDEEAIREFFGKNLREKQIADQLVTLIADLRNKMNEDG